MMERFIGRGGCIGREVGEVIGMGGLYRMEGGWRGYRREVG